MGGEALSLEFNFQPLLEVELLSTSSLIKLKGENSSFFLNSLIQNENRSFTFSLIKIATAYKRKAFLYPFPRQSPRKCFSQGFLLQ